MLDYIKSDNRFLLLCTETLNTMTEQTNGWVNQYADIVEGKVKGLEMAVAAKTKAISEATTEAGKVGSGSSLQDTLENLERQMRTIEAATTTGVIEAKVKALRKRIDKLAERIAELQRKIDAATEQEKSALETDKGNAETEKTKSEEKLKALYLRELHRPLPKKVDVPQTQENALSELKTVQERLLKDRNNQDQKLENYYNKAIELRKAVRENKTFNGTQTPEAMNKRLKEEKRRYRRHASLKALSEKLTKQDAEPLSPKAQERFLRLYISHLEDIKTCKEKPQDDRNDSEQAIATLAQNLEPSDIVQKIQSVNDLLNTHQSELNTALSAVTDIPTRQSAIKEHSEKLKTLAGVLLDPTTPVTGEYASQATIFSEYNKFNYQAQVQERIKSLREKQSTESDDPYMEIVRGFEGLSQSFLREYESERRLEREGPPEQRLAMAAEYAKVRLLDEFGDFERVREVYGEDTGQKFRTPTSIEAFKTELTEEVQERFNLLDMEKNDQNAPNNYEERLTQIKQRIESACQTEMTATEALRKTETDQSNKQNLVQAMKIDIAIARLKQQLGENNTDLRSIITNLSDSNADLNLIWTKITQLKNVPQNLNNEISTALNGAKFIQTPNGIAIVTPDANRLKTALMGTDTNSVESLAVALKSNLATKGVIEKLANEQNLNTTPNFENGRLILVSSEGDVDQLMHEVEHAVSSAIDAENADKPIERQALDELTSRLSSGEISRLMLEPDSNNPDRLSLSALTYLTPDRIGVEKGKMSKDDAEKIYRIAELSKKIVEASVQQHFTNGQTGEHADVWPYYYDTISQTIAQTIGSGLYTANGTIDFDKIINELQNGYSDLLGKNNQVTIPDDFNSAATTSVWGSQSLQTQLAQFFNHPGWDARAIMPSNPVMADDYSSAHSEMFKRLSERHKTPYEKEVGIFPLVAAEVPVVGGVLEGIAKKITGQGGRPWEYEGKGTNYNYLRGWGGVRRRFGLGSEQSTKFGSSGHMFWWVPFFGKSMKFFLEDIKIKGVSIDKRIKQAFPGREDSIFAERGFNPQKRWEFQMQNAFQTLVSMGYDQERAVRMMDMAGAGVKFENGRFDAKFSLLDFYEEELKPDGTVGPKGAIDRETADAIITGKFSHPRKPESKEKYNERMADLTEAMMSEENMNIGEVIKRAEKIFRTGIDPEIGKILREPDYYKDDQDHFERRGDLMVGTHVWYNIRKTNERGIVVNGEMFTIAEADELVERYIAHNIDKNFTKGIPELDLVDLQREHEIDTDPAKAKAIVFDPTQPNATTNNVVFQNNRYVSLDEEYYADPKDGMLHPYKLLHGERIRNEFFTPMGYARPIKGLEGDPNGTNSKQFFRLFNATYKDVRDDFAPMANKNYEEYMHRLTVARRAERSSYKLKTFFESFSFWTQRVGKLLILGGIIGAALTGAPFYAGLIASTLLVGLPSDALFSYRAKLHGGRRIEALKVIDQLTGQGELWTSFVLDPTKLNWPTILRLEAMKSTNEAMIEDLMNTKIPPGSAPNSLMTKLFGSVFGQKGLIAGALAT